MVVPAALYLAVAGGNATRPGWGVPVATDIAFALGVLALLGKRVPPALRVLLLALAVIDDLGAILVIALFYSAGVAWSGIAIAAAGVAGIFALRAMGLERPLAYVAPAVAVWAGVYSSGIHPTIAGVIVGCLTPVSHSKHLIHALHGWVAFVIMPVFALANAGVMLGGVSFDPAPSNAGWGVVAGLLLGKPAGVLVSSFVAVRSGLAAFPVGLGFRHIVVLGIVAGIGFTMSLFVAQLAFVDDELLSATKLGVLTASGAAMVIGLVVGRAVLQPPRGDGAARTADEAEASTES
jgi:NhaA family Na+:H+ antiporter